MVNLLCVCIAADICRDLLSGDGVSWFIPVVPPDVLEESSLLLAESAGRMLIWRRFQLNSTLEVYCHSIGAAGWMRNCLSRLLSVRQEERLWSLVVVVAAS